MKIIPFSPFWKRRRPIPESKSQNSNNEQIIIRCHSFWLNWSIALRTFGLRKNLHTTVTRKIHDANLENISTGSSRGYRKNRCCLNGLLNYIKIQHPPWKKDTVHVILEDVLRNMNRNWKTKDKNIKKFEKDLPETVVHEEQLSIF